MVAISIFVAISTMIFTQAVQTLNIPATLAFALIMACLIALRTKKYIILIESLIYVGSSIYGTYLAYTHPAAYDGALIIGEFVFLYTFFLFFLFNSFFAMYKASKNDDENYTNTKRSIQRNVSVMITLQLFADIFLIVHSGYVMNVKELNMWVFTVTFILTILITTFLVTVESKMIVRSALKQNMENIKNENEEAGNRESDTGRQDSTNSGTEVLPSETDGV